MLEKSRIAIFASQSMSHVCAYATLSVPIEGLIVEDGLEYED